MKLVFVIDSLGPYHVARLRSISRLANVLAIEVSEASSEYMWARSTSVPFSRLTLLSGDNVGDPRLRLLAALDAAAPDVVFTSGWSAKADIAALHWAGLNQVPVIVMSDSNLDDAPRCVAIELAKRRMLAHVAGAFTAGARSADYAARLGIPPEMIITGYDVIENSHFFARPDGARKGFLASARFIPKKNLPFLIRAHAAYRRLHRAEAPDEEVWDLTLLGDGPLRPAIQALAQENSGVTLAGFVQYSELPEFFARAGAFLHASTIEQWGLVVNEAMAAGLPLLVSCRCGCVSDLVNEGVNGYSLHPTDHNAWAARMLDLARMSPISRSAMGEASQRILTGFSPESHAKAAVNLAHAVLSRPVPRLRKADALLLAAVAARRLV